MPTPQDGGSLLIEYLVAGAAAIATVLVVVGKYVGIGKKVESGNGLSAREQGELKAHVAHAADRIDVLSSDVRRLFDRQEKLPEVIVKRLQSERENCPHAIRTDHLEDEMQRQSEELRKVRDMVG
jgi:CTP:molybdopterin cytidylyltransferase MocA